MSQKSRFFEGKLDDDDDDDDDAERERRRGSQMGCFGVFVPCSFFYNDVDSRNLIKGRFIKKQMKKKHDKSKQIEKRAMIR